MSIDSIVDAVRYCIDEEASNDTSFANASNGDNTKMNNIIKSKIGDAFHWLCLHAPAEVLTGNDGVSTTSIVADVTVASSGITSIPATGTAIGGYFAVATDFLRLVRVRGEGWHRAVMNPLSEDSEEYLQLYDSNGAEATVERPQAALILSATKKIEVYPKPTSVTYTYIKDPLAGGTNYSTTNPLIPSKAQGAFVYYLAFLTLSAYGDSRAPRMLEIAQMNLEGSKVKTEK